MAEEEKKKKKPVWFRLLKWVLSSILSIVVLLAIAFGFLYLRYQINVFKVAGQIKTLNQPVNLSSIIPNAFDPNTDMASAKSITDATLNGLISFDEGTQKYSIGGDSTTEESADNLVFTDKQIGAILNNLIEAQESLEVQFGKKVNLKDYGFKVVQVQFSNIGEKSADFNLVVKVELEKVKTQMRKFPLNWIAKAIPDELYISSTVTITQSAVGSLDYTTTGKCMRINNLTEAETADIFKIANTFLKTGQAKDFGKTLSDSFINVIIGNSTAQGLTYQLATNDSLTNPASGFKFEATASSNNYIIIR